MPIIRTEGRLLSPTVSKPAPVERPTKGIGARSISWFIFVHMKEQQHLTVVQLPSVVSLVSFQGRPTMIPESEIDFLRRDSADRHELSHILI